MEFRYSVAPLEKAFLAMETTDATPEDKIHKMQEILGKLKTCGILAVNQLVNKDPTARTEKPRQQTTQGSRNPLGRTTFSTLLCSVDVRHDCHKSPKCQPDWGLLGCCELYKLRSVEERIIYCKESKCCYVCGMGDLSDGDVKTLR